MAILAEIKSGFYRSEGLFRLMLLNVGVFVILKIIKLILFLSGSSTLFILGGIEYLAVPSNFNELLFKPWTLLTYMFVHEGFFHILFNMLILYWMGRIFCEYMGSKKIVPVYIMGGLAGALTYIIAYNLFPVFATTVEYSKLIGASAGVIAVMVAIATLIPNYTIHLLFFGGVKLKFVAIFSILLYVISIPDGNSGGNISHLGGALMGYFYTISMKKGNNIGSWIEKISAFITQKRSGRMKVVKGNAGVGKKYYGGTVKQREMAIDDILDKISKSGYSSLTEEEKEVLFKASNKKGP